MKPFSGSHNLGRGVVLRLCTRICALALRSMETLSAVAGVLQCAVLLCAALATSLPGLARAQSATPEPPEECRDATIVEIDGTAPACGECTCGDKAGGKGASACSTEIELDPPPRVCASVLIKDQAARLCHGWAQYKWRKVLRVQSDEPKGKDASKTQPNDKTVDDCKKAAQKECDGLNKDAEKAKKDCERRKTKEDCGGLGVTRSADCGKEAHESCVREWFIGERKLFLSLNPCADTIDLLRRALGSKPTPVSNTTSTARGAPHVSDQRTPAEYRLRLGCEDVERRSAAGLSSATSDLIPLRVCRWLDSLPQRDRGEWEVVRRLLIDTAVKYRAAAKSSGAAESSKRPSTATKRLLEFLRSGRPRERVLEYLLGCDDDSDCGPGSVALMAAKHALYRCEIAVARGEIDTVRSCPIQLLMTRPLEYRRVQADTERSEGNLRQLALLLRAASDTESPSALDTAIQAYSTVHPGVYSDVIEAERSGTLAAALLLPEAQEKTGQRYQSPLTWYAGLAGRAIAALDTRDESFQCPVQISLAGGIRSTNVGVELDLFDVGSYLSVPRRSTRPWKAKNMLSADLALCFYWGKQSRWQVAALAGVSAEHEEEEGFEPHPHLGIGLGGVFGPEGDAPSFTNDWAR